MLSLSILYKISIVYINQPQSPNSFHPTPFPHLSVHRFVLREGNGTPLQYSCLENPMRGGAWWAAVHRVVKSWTRLSDFTFTFHFHALEKEMATHSSVLAWSIPGMVEHRVGHDWSSLAVSRVYVYVNINIWSFLSYFFCAAVL